MEKVLELLHPMFMLGNEKILYGYTEEFFLTAHLVSPTAFNLYCYDEESLPKETADRIASTGYTYDEARDALIGNYNHPNYGGWVFIHEFPSEALVLHERDELHGESKLTPMDFIKSKDWVDIEYHKSWCQEEFNPWCTADAKLSELIPFDLWIKSMGKKKTTRVRTHVRRIK